MMYNLSDPTRPEVMMSTSDIRKLLALLDCATDKREVLNVARALREDYEKVLSPRGDRVRTYCDTVISLCLIALTGASQQVANALAETSAQAAVMRNEQLALITGWYEACCRHMRWAERTDGAPATAWEGVRIQFELVGIKAWRMRQAEYHLLANTMKCESHLRTTQISPEVLTTLNAQLTALQRCPVNQRMMECWRLLDAMVRHRTLPAEPPNYTILLYAQGELLRTVE